MASRPLRRGSTTVAAATLLVSGIVSAGAPPAAADAPSEAVIPAALRYTPRADAVAFAGPGGFVHRQEGQPGPVWTSYAGGPDVPVAVGANRANMPGRLGTGADIVADASGSTVLLQDMDAGTTSTITLPSGQSYVGTYGSRVLAISGADTTSMSLHLLALSGGQQTDTQVTGLPEGASAGGAPMVLAGDADSVLLRYTDSTGSRLAVLDLATGQATPVFGSIPTNGFVGGVLGGGYVGWFATGYNQPISLQLLPRSDLSAAEIPVQVPAPPLPSDDVAGNPEVAIVGQHILVDYDVRQVGSLSGTNPLGFPLYSMPLSGGSLTTVIDHTGWASFQAVPDGVVVAGGSSVTDWAARRVTADSSGALTVTPVDSDPPVPSPIDGLSLAGGQLFTSERDSQVSNNAFTRTVQLAGTTPSYGAHTAVGSTWAPSDCDTATNCAPPTGTGDGRISQLWKNANSDGDAVTVQEGSSGYLITPHATGGTLVDSDGRYTVYDGGSTGKQYIGDIDAPNNDRVLFTRPVTGAGLSGSTLWAADSTRGQVSATDLTTGKTMQSIETGAPCVPTEVQAAADRWVYWSCGTSGPAGVADTATGAQMPVPSGPAQLGDGFVVTHDTAAGKLVLTDVHTDTATGSDLTTLPADTAVPDDRRVTWAVDKYDGGIAYTDAQENIHLLDPHIPASPAIPAQNTTLLPGERLVAGSSLTSAAMRLTMQSDGNLVAYLGTGAGGYGPAIWSSGTSGHTGAYAVVQPDGNFVIYPKGGGPSAHDALWSTGTWGHPGAHAVLQDDGNLVMYQQGAAGSSAALWSTGSYGRSQTIRSGAQLFPGWWTQGQYTRLVMQHDGNLVMYRNRDGAAIWSSRTWGHAGAYALLQSDGNLVIYPKGGGPSAHDALWSTGTWGHPGAYAVMQNDGNLVIYRSGGSSSAGGSLWASGTWQTSR